MFRPNHSTVCTSSALLDTESRLVERAENTTAPRVATTLLRSVADKGLPGGGKLPNEQLIEWEPEDNGAPFDDDSFDELDGPLMAEPPRPINWNLLTAEEAEAE